MTTSAIIQNAQAAFLNSNFDIDHISNMSGDVIGIVVYRGNNPKNGWWTVKPSHIDGHVKLDLDDSILHLSITDCVKMIKKLNRS